MTVIVDFVRLKISIPIENIKKSEWKEPKGNWDSPWYFANKAKVKLKYSAYSQTLYVEGRIISLNTKSYYLNFDDFEDPDSVIEEVYKKSNDFINSKLIDYKVNIADMKVTQIEYSFNIRYNIVKKYIEFLNYLYTQNKFVKYKRYSDYTEKEGNDLNGSFYLKSNGDYKDNSLKNLCLNIYDKSNQLANKQLKNIEEHHKSYIKQKDIKESLNMLRIEYKAGYEHVKSICKKYNIQPTLRNLLNEDIAKKETENQLKRFFGTGDFYSKKTAEKIIADNNLKINLDIPISGLSEYKYKKFRKELEKLGICPYGFIPEEWGISKMDNPIKLILNKDKVLQPSGMERKNYDQ